MKRISLFIIVLLISISMIGCSEKSNTEELTSIYESLQGEYDIVNTLAADLYGAWFYGIYEDDHNTNDLADEVSLNQSQLDNVVCDLLYHDEFSYTVNCLIGGHTELNSYTESKDRLDILKNRIKAINPSNDEETEIIEKLEDYYSALVNLLELSENYPGSFNALQSDIQDYRNVVNGIESDLEFDLG